MDGDRERWLRLVPLVLVGLVVVALFVGAGTLLGGYLGRHASTPPRAAPTTPAPLPPSPEPSAKAPEAPRANPVTYEAEDRANTVSGGAFVAGYGGASGGRIVKNLGTWGSPAGAGKLTFTGVRVPAAGRYPVTIFYVHVNGEATRTLVVTVAGADPVRLSVSGGSACCRRQTVTLRLAAGVNKISVGTPSGRAPAIDKITVDPAGAG
jgi:hypothetical protein